MFLCVVRMYRYKLSSNAPSYIQLTILTGSVVDVTARARTLTERWIWKRNFSDFWYKGLGFVANLLFQLTSTVVWLYSNLLRNFFLTNCFQSASKRLRESNVWCAWFYFRHVTLFVICHLHQVSVSVGSQGYSPRIFLCWGTFVPCSIRHYESHLRNLYYFYLSWPKTNWEARWMQLAAFRKFFALHTALIDVFSTLCNVLFIIWWLAAMHTRCLFIWKRDNSFRELDEFRFRSSILSLRPVICLEEALLYIGLDTGRIWQWRLAFGVFILHACLFRMTSLSIF